MADDPIVRLARTRALRAIRDSAEIEVQLSNIQGASPILSVLVRAQDKAAEALTALAFCDENNPAHILQLQNEVRRYDDLVRWFAEIVTEGFEADERIQEADREEFAELLSPFPEGMQGAQEDDDTPNDA